MVAAALLALSALLCAASSAAGLRVLMVSTVSTRSHYIWTNALAEGLLAAGHHVVELTSLPAATPHPNRTTFAVGVIPSDDWSLDDQDEMVLSTSAYGKITMGIWFVDMNNKLTLESQAFRDAVKHIREHRENRFDVMVIDYPWQHVLIGMAGVAGRPPIVAVTAYIHPTDMSTLMGSPHLPALVPHDMADLPLRMNFWQRLYNLYHYVLAELMEAWFMWPAMEDMYRKHFGQEAPSMEELRQDVALAMVNSHPALQGARPIVPSIVEVGLLHARPGKPLPKDLKKWVDEAPDGFIYMSFGSIIKGTTLSQKKRRAVLKAFATLKQRIIWKFESDAIQEELPPNVKVLKWLPQNDILAHPKIRAFVSHCGGLSSQEVAYHGVPVLGVPFWDDQFRHCRSNERLGIGRVLTYNEINHESFLEALKDVAENPKYRDNARRLSAAVRDQKETPLERAVWWIEYVARTGGAPHLRSHALDLRWYQVHLLDLLAVVLVGPALLLLLLCRLCRRRRSSGTADPAKKRD